MVYAFVIPQIKVFAVLHCLMVYAFLYWINGDLCDRERYSDKKCAGQEQNYIGVVGRNSNNVEGWSGNGIFFVVFWTIFGLIGPKYLKNRKKGTAVLEFLFTSLKIYDICCFSSKWNLKCTMPRRTALFQFQVVSPKKMSSILRLSW